MKSFVKLLNRAYHYARAVLAGGPNYMILFVTARCNLRCPHCFYLEEIESAAKEKELKLADFEKITKSLPRLLQLTCTGGETFVRADIDEIIQLFYKNSNTRFFTLTTNGTFPERVAEKVEKIAKSCPYALIRVPMSLDGIEDVHDLARGKKGTWDKVMETYRLLRALANRVDNVRLDITSVLSKINEDNALGLVDFVKDRMEIENHTILYARGAIREKEKIVPAEIRYKELVTKTYERGHKKFQHPFFSRMFVRLREAIEAAIIEVQEKKDMPFVCQAGERLIEMNEEGNIFPCEILQTLLNEKKANARGEFSDVWMGNVRDFDYDVMKAINCEKALKIRKFIQNKGCACTFECAIGASIAFEPSNFGRFLNSKPTQAASA